MGLLFPQRFYQPRSALDGPGGNDAFTKILLHMDGANGGTTFADSNAGGSAHTWTANSATTDTGTAKFGTASLACGAGVGWIDTPDSADFTIGSGDFTVDLWFNRQGGDGTTRTMFGQIDSSSTLTTFSIDLRLLTTNVVCLDVLSGSTNTQVIGTTTFTTTGWHHVAGVRTGNTLKLFVDGVQEGGDVAFSSTVNDSAFKFAVGRRGEAVGAGFNGFLDEFRLSVGIARWTANFTPPTAAYS